MAPTSPRLGANANKVNGDRVVGHADVEYRANASGRAAADDDAGLVGGNANRKARQSARRTWSAEEDAKLREVCLAHCKSPAHIHAACSPAARVRERNHGRAGHRPAPNARRHISSAGDTCVQLT